MHKGLVRYIPKQTRFSDYTFIADLRSSETKVAFGTATAAAVERRLLRWKRKKKKKNIVEFANMLLFENLRII